MNKELDQIMETCTPSQLKHKLLEAEELKIEVEAVLLERVIYFF